MFDAPKLQNALLLCINVSESCYGTHYEFFVLEGAGLGDGSGRVRSWVENKHPVDDLMYTRYDFGFGFSDFGMKKAMKTFEFKRVE